MRTKLLVCLIVLISSNIFAQDISSSKTIPTTYDRSSIAVFYLDFQSGNHWDKVKASIDSLIFSDKYDNNNFNDIFLKPSFSRTTKLDSPQQELIKDLEIINAGRELISMWYNRKSDGTMNMDLINKRGRFTATDADFLRAQTSKRGNAALEDFGNRLINLTYILLIDIQNVQTYEEASVKNMKGWKATVTGYLFKIDFNEDIRNALYENAWIYDDDTEAIKAQKRKAFDELVIPVVPVLQKTLYLSAAQMESESGVRLSLKTKSMDDLLRELVQKSYDEVLYRIEMEVEEFKIKTSIYATRPIRAKIGLKEGLKTDYRFFAYEHVYNTKTNQAEPVRRGVIRVGKKSKIVDNRKEATGDMGTSQFYQVAGRKLDAGFTLQQRNDFGIEVSLGPEIGSVGGIYARLDYRLGRYIGIKAIFVYGEGGFDTDFLRYGAGIAKGFQLMRNIELRPYIGAGVESTESNSTSISSLYFRTGANLALNLKHNFQLIGGMGMYGFLGDATDSDGVVYGTWDDLYDRSGPATLIGIKVMF